MKLPFGFLEVGGPLAFQVHSLEGELGCHSLFYLAALTVQQTLVIGVELDKLLLGVRDLSLEDCGYRLRGGVSCQVDILILMALCINIKRCLGRWAVIWLTHLVLIASSVGNGWSFLGLMVVPRLLLSNCLWSLDKDRLFEAFV